VRVTRWVAVEPCRAAALSCPRRLADSHARRHAHVQTVGIEGIGQTTWAQAKAAGIAGHTRKPAYAAMECCGLKSRFTQWVNFNTDCYQEDVFARNWTQRVLAGGV
jgi:hypothetical protein